MEVNHDALELAVRRGRQLYDYDQAAWHVTDAFLEDTKNISKADIRGWVVTPKDKGLLVTFYQVKDGQTSGFYSALFVDGLVTQRKLLRGKEETRLNDEQLRLINVRAIVPSQKMLRCSNAPMNTVILPRDKQDEPDSLYLLTPQTEEGNYPFGGHYRIDVKDGKEVRFRAFTHSCISLSTKISEGSTAAGLFITHLLDPVPTEIHVFSMLAINGPVFVGTSQNSLIWEIGEVGGLPFIKPVVPKGAAAR